MSTDRPSKIDGVVSDIIYHDIGKGTDAVRCDDCGSAIILTDQSQFPDDHAIHEQTDENQWMLACDCKKYPLDNAESISSHPP